MTDTNQLARIAPYLGRLLEDEYIQDQIGEAITGLRRSTRRAGAQSVGDTLKDRKLAAQLRGAADSLTKAGRALQAPAPRKRHPVRRALMLTVVVSAAALVWRARSASNSEPSS